MKVLITTDWYQPCINGVVTSVLNLQRELNAQGHQVRILTLSQTTRSYAEGDVTYIGAVSAGRIYPGARLRAKPALRLIQDLIDWAPDVIHSQCEFSTFLMARKIAEIRNIPIVHTYHTVYEDYTHYFSPSRKWGRRMVSLFSRRIISRTACVIAPTEKVRRILDSYRVNRPVYVVPTGIDLRKFALPADAGRRASLRQALGIPTAQFVLLYVGRLAEEKNIEELLACQASLARPDVTLLLVGGGPYRSVLEQRVRELGIESSVVFAGMVPPDQIAEYYRAGDLFVSASSSETQGLTYLEALSSGLPALCRKDSCLEGVLEDGVNGWQFENTLDFRARLDLFLSDESLRRHMARQAEDLAQRRFSASVFANRVTGVYTEAIRRHNSAQGEAAGGFFIANE